MIGPTRSDFHSILSYFTVKKKLEKR